MVATPETGAPPQSEEIPADEAEGPLFRVVYVSRRRDGLETDEIVERIVLPSLRTNYKKRVSGRLWFGPTRFVQVMEGPPQAVHELFEAIKLDGRHRDVRLLASGPASSRLFERYSMKVIEGDELAQVNTLIRVYAAPGMDEPIARASSPRVSVVRSALRWLLGRRPAPPRAR